MQRTLRHALGSAALVGLAVAFVHAPPALAQDPRFSSGSPEEGQSVDVNTFYEALGPHGRWFSHPQYGYVWSPEVDRNWRPYTRGRWQFTEEHGWYWQAEEPWGWAVFHYGRWFLDDDSGWVWVPGTEWAPAWVAWRHSDEQVGWAPLPPEAEWRGGGLQFSSSYYDSPRYSPAWCFVPIVALTSYSIYRHIYAPSRNVYFVRSTNWVPSHRYANNRIYNVGFDRYRYEQVTRRPITPVRIVVVDRPNLHNGRGAPAGTVQAYRPRVVVNTSVTVAPPRLVEPPRRDWQHGRPGIARPASVPPSSFGQGAPNPGGNNTQPSILRPGQQRPLGQNPQGQPVNPTPQAQPTTVPPGTTQPPASTQPGGGNRRFTQPEVQRPQGNPPAGQPGNNPLIQRTPDFQRQTQPTTQPQQPAVIQRPVQQPPQQPNIQRQTQPTPQPSAQQGQRGGGQPGAGQGGPAGQGKAQGQGDPQAKGKRPPPDPNAPPQTR